MTRDKVIIELTILACHKPEWLTPKQLEAISQAAHMLRQPLLPEKGGRK